MLCSERIRLFNQYQAAVDAYLAAAAAIRDIHTTGFADSLQEILSCRSACDQAMLEWQTHIREHGCGNIGENGLDAAPHAR